MLRVLAALVFPLSATSVFAQCAMCRASLLHSQGVAELLAGLRQGIVLLLAMPLVIAAMVVLRLRRAARERAKPATE